MEVYNDVEDRQIVNGVARVMEQHSYYGESHYLGIYHLNRVLSVPYIREGIQIEFYNECISKKQNKFDLIIIRRWDGRT